MKTTIGYIGVLLAMPSTLGVFAHSNPSQRPNILFIAIDDLRSELPCYGANHILAPNIESLAARSSVFLNTISQQPVSGPSRSSLLTGRYPVDAVMGNKWNIHEFAPDAVTLPHALKSAGYVTEGNGKVFHGRDGDASFSSVPFDLTPRHQDMKSEESQQYVNPKNKRGPFFECAEVEDSAYVDGKTCLKVIDDLKRLSQSDKPFFLACGFVRPHLPFYAPKKYWDMYDENKIPLAPVHDAIVNSPTFLKPNYGEFHSYGMAGYKVGTPEFERKARHGYFASVSYVDAQVGKLLATLKELGLDKNTIVVLWGDHGWQLGEHNFWGKHSVLRRSSQTVLMIHTPENGANKIDEFIELVDIYPTLCELTSTAKPSTVQGKSLAGLMKDPDSEWKGIAYTRYLKSEKLDSKEYSFIRNRQDDGGFEYILFDKSIDRYDSFNVANDPKYADVVVKFNNILDTEYCAKK